MNQFYTSWQSPLCKILLVADDIGLTRLRFLNNQIPDQTMPDADWEHRPENLLFLETISQLTAFFAGKSRAFSLPLHPSGTEFQQLTWRALQTIPYGETRSYQQIARQIGRPKAARAVGMANSKNPLPLLIPCHRVIGASGKLVGFAAGIEIKQKLLELETKKSDFAS